MTEPMRKPARKAIFGDEDEGGVPTLERGAGGMEGMEPQLRELLEAMEAVRKGDLSQKITEEAQGEILQFKETINCRPLPYPYGFFAKRRRL